MVNNEDNKQPHQWKWNAGAIICMECGVYRDPSLPPPVDPEYGCIISTGK